MYSESEIIMCDPVHSLPVLVSRSNAAAGTFVGMLGYFKIAMATYFPRLAVLSAINSYILM
jgi:hypothetical protein